MNEIMMDDMRSKEASKKVTFSLPPDSETEDITQMQLEKDIDPSEIKSSFEKRQEKVTGFAFCCTLKQWAFFFFNDCFICSVWQI